ncbi:MAG: hypothetical protein ACP5GW_06620 [Caldisericaceae bacterium]
MKTAADTVDEAIDKLDEISAIIGRAAFRSVYSPTCDEYLGILKELHELKEKLQGMRTKK